MFDTKDLVFLGAVLIWCSSATGVRTMDDAIDQSESLFCKVHNKYKHNNDE